MKLLYILSEYLPDSGGGIISHYARILPRLVERGHEVTVVLASKDKLGQPDYDIDGVRVRPLKAKFLEQYANRFERWAGLDIFYYMLPLAWAAWEQAQEGFDYDVVEATDWALLFAPWVASPKRSPLVVSFHGSCGQVDWFGKCEPRLLDGDLVRMVEAAALRGADVVHANSRANAEFWQEKTGREIRVIPPAYGGGTKADLTTECTEDTEDSTESKDSEEGVKYLSHGGTESIKKVNEFPVFSASW
jgi:glycosyltransferase involved in cell wall biosynthesis